MTDDRSGHHLFTVSKQWLPREWARLRHKNSAARLHRAAPLGWERVMLVGDAPYYGRFGFFRLDHVVMPPPTNPERVLGRALVPGAWDGVTGDVTRWTD